MRVRSNAGSLSQTVHVAQTIVQEAGDRLLDDVTLWVFPEEDAEVAAEILASAPKLHVRSLPKPEERLTLGGHAFDVHEPVWAVGTQDAGPSRARFFGTPQGRELDVLVEILLDVSRHRRVLSPISEEAVRLWRKPHRISILTTPDCPQCARLIQISHAIALANPNVVSTTVDLDAFRELIPALDIRGVPVTFVDHMRLHGPVVEWALVQRLTLFEQTPASD